MDSSPGGPLQVSVVVPTYNAACSLRRGLDALLAQDDAPPYEIIVSDDGSTDDTARMMGRYTRDERVKYFPHQNVQRAENRNIGARQARGEQLIFMDSDMLATRGFVRAHVAALALAGERGLVSGAVPVAQECRSVPTGRYLAGKWERRLQALQREPHNIELMQSNNFSITRSFFERIGGFDTGFLQYGGEDTDFFARAALYGAEFRYSAEALAYHLVERSFSLLLAKAPSAARMSQRVAQRYPMLAHPNAAQAESVENLKGRIWRVFRRMPGTTWLLLQMLPFIERVCSDRVIFLVYNSLISDFRMRALE